VYQTLLGIENDEAVARELMALDKKRADLAERISAAETNQLPPARNSNSNNKNSVFHSEKRSVGFASVVRAFRQGQTHEHRTVPDQDSDFADFPRARAEGAPVDTEGWLSSEGYWSVSREEKLRNAEALRAMMLALSDKGLKPDGVPPHKDSFFLALVKGLHRAGLCPKGYNFEPGEILGSRNQFPQAAKLARFELLRILSAKAPIALNDKIAGWRLSTAEFCRYFSKAWWHVPAARNDLFTAAAHHFRVSIECLTVQDGRLERETFMPPDGSAPLSHIVICRYVLVKRRGVDSFECGLCECALWRHRYVAFGE
jgi:hypothetical protein